MNLAENRARRNRTGVAADRLANAARLGVLERYLGTTIKRYRDPGMGGAFVDAEDNKGSKDEAVVVKVE